MLCTRCLYNILDKYIPTCSYLCYCTCDTIYGIDILLISFQFAISGRFGNTFCMALAGSRIVALGLQVLTTSFANEGMSEIIGEEERRRRSSTRRKSRSRREGRQGIGFEGTGHRGKEETTRRRRRIRSDFRYRLVSDWQ